MFNASMHLTANTLASVPQVQGWYPPSTAGPLYDRLPPAQPSQPYAPLANGTYMNGSVAGWSQSALLFSASERDITLTLFITGHDRAPQQIPTGAVPPSDDTTPCCGSNCIIM